MIGKNKTMMIVTTRVKIKTTVNVTGRIYHEGEGEKEEERGKLLVLEKAIIENKSLL
jgi:hypothetical protein